jgi:hypothetical protein
METHVARSASNSAEYGYQVSVLRAYRNPYKTVESSTGFKIRLRNLRPNDVSFGIEVSPFGLHVWSQLRVRVTMYL